MSKPLFPTRLRIPGARLVFITALGLPLLELFLLLRVAQAVGALATLMMLLASVVAGMVVMRHHGRASLVRLRAALLGGQSPAGPMLDALLAQLAGGLLILPGFGSDAGAICLLIRPLRRWLARRLAGPAGATGATDARIIEGEFERRDQDRLP
ncbi:MAG TPA: FxsA family protein [Immundisolibacter sp.]